MNWLDDFQEFQVIKKLRPISTSMMERLGIKE